MMLLADYGGTSWVREPLARLFLRIYLHVNSRHVNGLKHVSSENSPVRGSRSIIDMLYE